MFVCRSIKRLAPVDIGKAVESESLFTKCNTCGKSIPKSVKNCSQCGTNQKKLSTLKWIGIGFMGLIVIRMINSPNKSPDSSSDSTSRELSNAVAPISPERPTLEIESWHCDKEYGYVFVRGEVKNVSSLKIENVVAVGEFRTKSGELVKSEDALLDFNPILPGQTSPFSVGGTDNPSIQSCQLAFKYLFGGSVAHTDRKQSEKK